MSEIETRPGDIWRLAVSPCGKTVAVVAGGIHLFDVQSQTEHRTLPADTHANCLMFSPDGQRLVVAGGGDSCPAKQRIRVYDVSTLEMIADFEAHAAHVRMARFNFDQSLLVSCGVDAAIKLWDTGNWNLVGQLSGHETNVQDVWFSTDGQLIISGGLDGKPRTWNVVDRRNIAIFKGHVETGEQLPPGDPHRVPHRTRYIYSVGFSPDASVGVSGSAGGVIRAWNSYTADQIAEVNTGSPVNFLTFTPDGATLIAVLSHGSFLLINPTTWEIELKVEAHNAGTHGHALTADGSTLVTGSLDGTVKLWDVPSGTQTGFIPVSAGVDDQEG
jgi:WD40 repeat protein